MCYNKGMAEKYAGHGGKREGAGRPPALKAQIEKAEALAKKLNIQVKAGLDVVADKFPDIVRVIVNEALGLDDQGNPTRKPNVKVAMELFKATAAMVDLADEDGNRPFMKTLERMTRNAGTVNVQLNDNRRLGDDVEDSDGGLGGGANPRTVEGRFEYRE